MKRNVFKIIVCASGGGGNFQALIDARKENNFEIISLIVDRDCGAVSRAKNANIPVHHLKNSKQCLGVALCKAFVGADLIVLAGFMPIVPKDICERWEGKIINTHPSLLPKYGGKGMYGVKVQEAVMKAGEDYAGCTVHFVNSDIDGGQIVLQKSIPVNYEETPWELGGRVFLEETKLLLAGVKLLQSKHVSGR